MLKRFREAIEAGRRAVAEDIAQPAVRPVVALMLLEASAVPAEVLLEALSDRAEGAGARPLLILTVRSASGLARNGTACEFLPLAEDLHRATGDAPDAVEAYILRRLELILVKWSVGLCLFSGADAADLARRFQARHDTGTVFEAFEDPGRT